MRIAIVGASGFIGQALISYLLEHSAHELIALSRSPVRSQHPAASTRLLWRGCDLHNLLQLEEALQGVDCAVYLVHSMLPSARLNQGSFSDFDLSLADNFGRTARGQAVQRVIYLSGLIPEKGSLSEHLRSRLEVEDALRAYVPSVTCLRAGMIIGPQGSSFTVMCRLVQRLPALACPTWAHNLSQVVALEDVVRALVYCIETPETEGQTLDIGAEPAMSYRQMLEMTARLLGKRRLFLRLPFISLGLSKFWVRLITGAPPELIYPLIDSLGSSMLVRTSHRWISPAGPLKSFEQSAAEVLPQLVQQQKEHPHAFRKGGFVRKQSTVRSIQRLPLPDGQDARWVAEEYLKALPSIFPLVVKVVREGDLVYLKARLLGWTLLLLEHSRARSSSDRQLFYVRGGLLCSRWNERGRLELRETLGGRWCLAAVHDFRPALPWFIYRLSQAEVHSWFMQRLAKRLAASGPLKRS